MWISCEYLVMMGLTCRHIFAVYIKKDISQFKILEFNTRWLALRQNINKTDNYVVNLAELREILKKCKRRREPNFRKRDRGWGKNWWGSF